jgi:RES domain-containing protein
VPALYTSLRPETAWLEAQQGFSFKAQPMTLVAYAVDCADIADLTAPEGRAAHDAPLDALNGPWRTLAEGRGTPPSWLLHQRLVAAGCAGLIVPSFAARARPEDVNAVFWRWGRTPPHQVRVVDEFARLPRDQSSWR